jgi:hypothetical protein
MCSARRMGRTVRLVSVSAKAAMWDKNLPPIGVLRLEGASGSTDDDPENAGGAGATGHAGGVGWARRNDEKAPQGAGGGGKWTRIKTPFCGPPRP